MTESEKFYRGLLYISPPLWLMLKVFDFFIMYCKKYNKHKLYIHNWNTNER